MSNHTCSGCMARLLATDRHDLCPRCLGVEHSRQGLTGGACINCCFMPLTLKVSQLSQVKGPPLGSQDRVGAGTGPHRHPQTEASGAPPRKGARKDPLVAKAQ